ncbi:hypothetical protein PORY_000369 [Pneumocystis oryctolagi]|uniref:Uncharacterized protein n=1 Tax=Pneumocystis oryctolagi TaxID=42067 RepID=A0ACB7CFC3_9ASCO|nr:hypothetical protein PORY_000369 [Pneumocystis oryctolagi]
MSHLNAFCLIKDKYNLSFKKRKKSLKHLSKKKCEKNQSILPFYKKKKSLFIIYSDEDNSKNDEFNSNSSSFTTSLSNQSKLLKNSDLFKIYESEDSKSIFNSIKKTNFEKEIGPNKSPEQKCFENIDILHESEFHKNNSKNLANTNNFFHKNKKENSNNKSDLIVDTENIIDNNLYPIVDTENIIDNNLYPIVDTEDIIDNNLYPIVDTEDIIDNNLYPIVDTEDIIDNSSETLAFSENQSLNENTRKNNTNHYSPSNISTNSSDSESFSTIARIKKRKFISSASNSDNESQLEIENELKDLNKKDIIKERTRGSKWNIKKTMFQRQLQKLKKKKNKTLEDSSDELEIINTSQSISNYDSNSSFSDNEINKNDYESTALDNFIVDDELIGEPYIDVPVEFTIFSYQGISSHFKIFLQYKIHKLLNPEIKESEQFVFSLKYLERKFNSLRDSVLSSSVWKLPFIDAL